MERSILWLEGQESPRQFRAADLPVPDGGLAWLDLTGATAADLAAVAATLDLDPHTVEDALATRERPKIVHLQAYSFMTGYYCQYADERVTAGRISAYMLPHLLLTIHPDELDMDEVVLRWRQDHHLVELGVHGLLQGLLDAMVDAQFDILESLDAAIDDLSRDLFAKKPDLRAVQERTFQLRGELVALHRVIPQTRDIVASVLRQSLAEDWPTELRIYWEDVNDHVLRAAEWTDALRDLISSIFEASLALNDSRMNEVMKKLAAWAAIIAVPTLITGWFGMNVPYPGFSEPVGVFLAAGIVLAASTTLFIVFKAHDWL